MIVEQRARDQRRGDAGEDQRPEELEGQASEEDLQAEERSSDRRVVGGGNTGGGAGGDEDFVLIGAEPEPARVVIRPKAVTEAGFKIVKLPDGAYLISGEKPERWVRQTDFTNDEAVGYLADRLARLGIEEALAKEGAEEGDTVLIGTEEDAVVFDWDPTLPTSSGHVAGPRGTDRRLE